MNRSFTYQNSEVDCACFDFGIREQTFLQRNRSDAASASQHGLLKNSSSSTHQKMPIKQHNETKFKKSLKRKILNKTASQSNKIKSQMNKKMVRHESTNTQWTGQLREYQYKPEKIEKNVSKKQLTIYNKQNINIRKSKGLKTQIEQIWGKQNFVRKQKNLHEISVPTLKINMSDDYDNSFNSQIKNKGYISSKKYFNFNIHDNIDKNTINVGTKKNKIILLKQNVETPMLKIKYQQHQKDRCKQIHQPSQIDSQEKTIKRRNSILTSLYNIRETYTNKNLQSVKNIPLESIKYLKRVSIRGDSNPYVDSIIPRQIESFDEENVSSAQSQVIEKGRYTWAPDSHRKPENDFHFISSLHINTNRTNRPSKMILGDDI